LNANTRPAAADLKAGIDQAFEHDPQTEWRNRIAQTAGFQGVRSP
jgi:hypothetical protein